jgi:hypothetical protein
VLIFLSRKYFLKKIVASATIRKNVPSAIQKFPEKQLKKIALKAAHPIFLKCGFSKSIPIEKPNNKLTLFSPNKKEKKEN